MSTHARPFASFSLSTLTSRSRCIAVVGVLLAAVAICGACLSWRPEADGSTRAAEAAAALDAGALQAFFDAETRVSTGAATEAELMSFYEARGFAPAWLAGGKARPEAGPLLAALEKCEDPDRPARLRAEWLANWMRWVDAGVAPEDARLRLERDLTVAYLDCAARSHGRLLNADPTRFRWDTRPVPPERASLLAEALREERLEEALAALAEPNPQMARLAAQIDRYRGFVAAGGWPRLPEGPTLEMGEPADPAVLAVLAERLAIEGFMTRAKAKVQRLEYDDSLAAAVGRFQESRGLYVDGKVGTNTRAALNVPADDLLFRLQLNLERSRWLPAFAEGHSVLVNIPAFRLWVLENGEPGLSMRVVVGKKDWQTPVLADRIRYLVVNPAWYVPHSIAADEVVPKLAEDPEYLHRQGFQVLSLRGAETVDPRTVNWSEVDTKTAAFRLRQAPGPLNPLGRIKFIFPNEHNVYLHDTNARAAFQHSDRARSHGCVRVEKPMELAAALLTGEMHRQVEESLTSRRPATISLDRPVPVYMIYMTAWVRDDGVVEFFEDVYDRDPALYATLAGESPDEATSPDDRRRTETAEDLPAADELPDSRPVQVADLG